MTKDAHKTLEPIKRFVKNDFEGAKNFFDKNGFAIISDFYPIQDLLDLKEEVKNIINAYLIKAKLPIMSLAGDNILTSGINALEEKDHDYVSAVYDTIFLTPSFFRICGNKDTAKYVKSLLGIDETHPLYGYSNRCRIDPPRDNRATYDWHQEVFYTVPRGSYIQTWAPLMYDTTIDNGTIEIAAGSHKEQIAKQTRNELAGRPLQILIDQNILNKYQQYKVEMKIGELLFISGYLFHRSGNNTSDQVRYSLVGMYHDVKHKPFFTPKLSNLNFRKSSPKEYFEEVIDK